MSSLPSIRLTPSQTLRLEYVASEELQSIHTSFEKDWVEGWFDLAASKPGLLGDPSVHFWQEVASFFITTLCHLPEEEEQVTMPEPDREKIEEWIAKAPPMTGGEYLSFTCLAALQTKFYDWVAKAALSFGGIHPFLQKRAPLWRQVGRVCFHLAENKKDADRPFAFLATYSTGFGAGGKLKHLPLGEALKQYAGSNNRSTLIKLLTPLHNASQKCAWVQELVTSSEVYRPLAWSPKKAYAFLSAIPLLEESGLSIRIPNWWKKRRRAQVAVSIGCKEPSKFGAAALLNFDCQAAIGDTPLTEEELSQLLAGGEPMVFFKGEWIEVDKEKLQEALQHWKSVKSLCKNGELSFAEGMRLLAGAPLGLSNDPSSARNDLTPWVKITAREELEKLLGHIKNPQTIADIGSGELRATLRPYQQEGVKWLVFLARLNLGACLADDMGLGKTLQVLAMLLVAKKESKASSLLIVPASLLTNWKQEAVKFTPSLNILLLHPSELKNREIPKNQMELMAFFQDFDLVITTYSMITRLEELASLPWHLVILDEAQAIKNPGTKQTLCIKKLRSSARIALTGTPIENRITDLWSLFDFLNPSLLGSAQTFKTYIDALQNSPGQFEPLRKLVGPYILRRMKTDPKIIQDLPAKIETTIYCHLSLEQIKHYQATVQSLSKSLQTIDPKDRRGLVLKTLIELKQICNHPDHYLGSHEFIPSHSGKFERLGAICEELTSRQEKVLVFTQFAEIIPALEEYLSKIFGSQGVSLHGGTPIKKRKELVDRFQTDDNVSFFILSIRAGGTGLTLTAANHVIHFDRWWNPAVENQATDRAFRIGQKKNVQVHKFITTGTVEERIDEILSSKAQLARDLFPSAGEEVSLTELSDNEIINMLSLDIDKAMVG